MKWNRDICNKLSSVNFLNFIWSIRPRNPTLGLYKRNNLSSINLKSLKYLLCLCYQMRLDFTPRQEKYIALAAYCKETKSHCRFIYLLGWWLWNLYKTHEHLSLYSSQSAWSNPVQTTMKGTVFPWLSATLGQVNTLNVSQ